jgi:hypothetical protein
MGPREGLDVSEKKKICACSGIKIVCTQNFKYKQDRQCTYKGTLRYIRVRITAVMKQ